MTEQMRAAGDGTVENAAETRFAARSTWDGNVAVSLEVRGDPEREVVVVSAAPAGEPSRFRDVRFEGATFHNVNLTGAKFSEAVVQDIDIWSWGRNLTSPIDGLRINGVEIGPLLEAELDRRFPERLVLRDVADVAGLRAAAQTIEHMWQPTIERARLLGEDALNVRVDDGLSFIETLRHLVFGFDAWVRRVAFREPSPFHVLALGYPDDSGTWSAEGKVPWSTVGIDIDARPSLDEVLVVREENFSYMNDLLVDLTDEDLPRVGDPILEPGYPTHEHSRRSVGDCLRARINEEWWHHQYAMRDLAVLEQRA